MAIPGNFGLCPRGVVSRAGRSVIAGEDNSRNVNVIFANNRGVKFFSSLHNLPFGELYAPRDSREKALQAQIIDQIPFDMVKEWTECNEIDFKRRLKYMPEQFAEAAQRYTTDPKDFLLGAILRHCTQKKSKVNASNLKIPVSSSIASEYGVKNMEEYKFLNSIAEKTYELLDRLNSPECGIILKCFLKIGYRNYILQRHLIRKILARGQTFTPYAILAALSTIISWQSDNYIKKDDRSKELSEFLNAAVSLALGHIEKFDLSTLSKLANLLSRVPHGTERHLNIICDFILSNYSKFGESNTEWTEEVVHFLANSFSRKNILNKSIFDNFSRKIKTLHSTYSLDTLVSLSNSFSKFGNAGDSKYLDIFCLLADQIILKRDALTNRHVCVVSNAFAKACILHEHLFSVLDEIFVFSIDLFDHRQMSMIIHAFSKLGYKSKNHELIWQNCIKRIDSYGWQSLTMIFQSYIKVGHVDEVISRRFCERFNDLFNSLNDEPPGSSLSEEPSTAADLPQPTTFVSLIYSLVKGQLLHSNSLLIHIANACLENIDNYGQDEIANLALSFSKIYTKCMNPDYARDDSTSQLKRKSHLILEKISGRLDDPKTILSEFTMVKIIKSFGECGFTKSASSVLNLVKRNVLVLEKLSYAHVVAIMRALSTLGVHDEDVLTVLSAIKHRKSIKHLK